MHQVNVPDLVCGVHSLYFKNKKSDEKLILEKMAADAEELIEVITFIFFIFNISLIIYNLIRNLINLCWSLLINVQDLHIKIVLLI